MNKQNVNQKIRLNSQNLPFREYYKSLKDEPKAANEAFSPLVQFLLIAAQKTGKHPGSIRRWAYGTAKPNILEKKALAELLNSDVKSLFPEEL